MAKCDFCDKETEYFIEILVSANRGGVSEYSGVGSIPQAGKKSSCSDCLPKLRIVKEGVGDAPFCTECGKYRIPKPGLNRVKCPCQ